MLEGSRSCRAGLGDRDSKESRGRVHSEGKGAFFNTLLVVATLPMCPNNENWVREFGAALAGLGHFHSLHLADFSAIQPNA